MPPNWLVNKIKTKKLKYFEHLKTRETLEHNSLEKHIIQSKLEGQRKESTNMRWKTDQKGGKRYCE